MEWLLGDSNRIPPHFVRLHLAVLDLREIWRGVNAPTAPFNFAGLKPFQFFGLSVPEIFYLIAVAVLWYLVGHFHEQRQMQVSRILAVAILVWGAVLFFLAIVLTPEAFPWTFTFGILFRPIRLLTALLHAAWSVVLIWFSVKSLREATHVTRS